MRKCVIKEELNGSNFGTSQDHMHMPSCDTTSFDDFLGHLKDPSVCSNRDFSPILIFLILQSLIDVLLVQTG